MLRLDKYLTDMGCGTRSEVKKLIRQGRVTVDGQALERPEIKVDERCQKVAVDGRQVGYEVYEYYMLYKPAGVISATEDRKNDTVIDLVRSKKRKDLFPVGRLDKDTEGLLLITNDGVLAHRLLSPKKHVDKCYYAKVRGRVTDEDKEKFREGVDIGTAEQPEFTMPSSLEIIKGGDISEICLTIQEGKYHQVKRMFRAVGKEVIYLKRQSMGPLRLDDSLKPGEYRMLTDHELKELNHL